MTASSSRLAYDEIFDALNHAVETDHGIRIHFNRRDSIYDNNGEAFQFRIRVHSARKIDREDNAKIYGIAHPLHGRSQYDTITASIRIEDGEVYLYLLKRSLTGLAIEELTEEMLKPKQRVVEYEFQEQKLIESPQGLIESPEKMERRF